MTDFVLSTAALCFRNTRQKTAETLEPSRFETLCFSNTRSSGSTLADKPGEEHLST